jgi:hypothetical protein
MKQRIPEEHVAARELERQLRQLGEEARAPAPAPVRRRRRRWSGGRGALGVAVGVGIGLAGAAGAAKVFQGDDGSTISSEKQPGDVVARVPAAERPALARAADPGGGPPWTVRLYTGRGGKTCEKVGRVVGGRFGQILQDGRFKRLPADATGTCGDASAEHLIVNIQVWAPLTGDRTAIFGTADRTVLSLSLRFPGAAPMPVPIAADGTFVYARRGHRVPRGAVAVARTTHGRLVHPLTPP